MFPGWGNSISAETARHDSRKAAGDSGAGAESSGPGNVRRVHGAVSLGFRFSYRQ